MQGRTLDATQKSCGGSVTALEFDPGPAASAQARVTRVHSARPISAAPEAPRMCAITIRLAIDVLFAGVRHLARRRHRSPVGRDDAA